MLPFIIPENILRVTSASDGSFPNLISAEVPLKQKSPMELTPFPIVMLSSAEQFSNTELPIAVTESWMLKEVSDVHPKKASFFILFGDP